MFPAGMAGVALLLLRASVAATLVANVIPHGPFVPSFGTIAITSLPVILMIGGFLTPYACFFACLIQLSVMLGGNGANVFHLMISMLNSGILAGLGPGAFSVDARVFGRRIVIFPSGRS